MQLIKFRKPRESCMLYAAAMCLELDPDTLSKALGHDGTEVVFSGLPSPYCLRGVTICEVNLLISKMGLEFGTIVAMPVVEIGEYKRQVFEDPLTVFQHVIKNRRGILIGSRVGDGIPHAIGRDEKGNPYDPSHDEQELRVAVFHPLCSNKPNLTKLRATLNLGMN